MYQRDDASVTSNPLISRHRWVHVSITRDGIEEDSFDVFHPDVLIDVNGRLEHYVHDPSGDYEIAFTGYQTQALPLGLRRTRHVRSLADVNEGVDFLLAESHDEDEGSLPPTLSRLLIQR